jgi:hypothetical protein
MGERCAARARHFPSLGLEIVPASVGLGLKTATGTTEGFAANRHHVAIISRRAKRPWETRESATGDWPCTGDSVTAGRWRTRPILAHAWQSGGEPDVGRGTPGRAELCAAWRIPDEAELEQEQEFMCSARIAGNAAGARGGTGAGQNQEQHADACTARREPRAPRSGHANANAARLEPHKVTAVTDGSGVIADGSDLATSRKSRERTQTSEIARTNPRPFS